MSKTSSNSTFGSKTRLIGPFKDGGVGRGGRGGGKQHQVWESVGGCRGLILDPNVDCEDILEVVMKFRCQKRPQTQHLDQKQG